MIWSFSLPPSRVFCRCALMPGLAVAAGLTNGAVLAQPPRDDRPALVRALPAETRELNREQSFIGTLQPIRRAIIGSAVEDRVSAVLVDEGQWVEGPVESADGQSASLGQPLIEIQRTTVDLQFEAARIELELREKAFEELELSIPAEIELQRASVRQIEAQRDYARQVFLRMEGLGSSAAQRELEESRSLYDAQEQSLIAAQAELNKLEATKDVRLAIARKNVAAQQSELDRLEDLRGKYTITAPFSGFVTAVNVEKGNWVTSGAAAIEMIQIDPIEMRVSIPQEHLASLQQSVAAAGPDGSLAATVRIAALGMTVDGIVSAIVPGADERTRAIPVIIRIPNPVSERGRLLYPGLLAEATLSIGQRVSATMVPKDALVPGQNETVVFVASPDGDKTVARREVVRTGAADDVWIAVTGNIAPGDLVVTQGNERLRDGQLIEVLKDDSRP